MDPYPTEPDGGQRVSDPRVTLVLGRPDQADDAIDFAFTAASRRDAYLLVIVSAQPPAWADFVAWESALQEELDTDLARWQEKHPDVGVAVEIVPPAEVDLTHLAATSLVLVAV